MRGVESGAASLVKGLAAGALAQLQHLNGASPARAPRDSLAVAFRRLVEKEFRSSAPVQDYARRLNATPYLLNRACRDAFGCGPKAMLAERRLLEAKRLLLFTIRSVEDIGHEAGLDDPAYFSRAFKRATGSSPRLWRAESTATKES